MSGAVRPGDVIAGKYRVERVLGEGGMGYVVAARHLALDQMVALKFMREEVITKDYRKRFHDEARNTVRLKSKHVSRVLDVSSRDERAPYMVLEYLEGKDLSELLHDRMKDGRGPFSPPEACEYVIQACEAIAEAHSHGIVHRDLKPANLFLTLGPSGEPVVKVLDFGVSKVLDLGIDADTAPGGRRRARAPDPESAITKVTDLLGSPSYMAPEQLVSARDADIQSDIWSLGVILFRLVSGRAPFTGSALGELVQAIMNHPIPSLREARPDIPPGLEHVVARCLERDKSRRLTDVTELARLLAPYAPATATPSLERIALLGPALATAPPSHRSGPSDASAAGNAWTRGHAPTAPSLRDPPKEMGSATAVVFGAIFVVILTTGVAAIALKYRTPAPQSGSTPARTDVSLDPFPPPPPIPPADPATTGVVAPPPSPSPLPPLTPPSAVTPKAGGPRFRPRPPPPALPARASDGKSEIPATRE